MHAILKFDLPQDRDAFTLATKGIDYYCALFDIANEIRSMEKNSDDHNQEFVDDLKERFYSILEYHRINLEEVE